MTAAAERLANDPSSELWGEHRARYRFATANRIRGAVLDVACGAGLGLEMLRSTGARVVGMDLEREALAMARKAFPEAPVAYADATRLPLPDDSLDVVVSFETLEHVADAEALIVELRRVLRPDGRLVLSTPNRDFGPPELHTGNPYHVREFTAAELRDLLERYFGEVKLYGQYPSAHYRYVPFLMVDSQRDMRSLVWKALNRLPSSAREWVARITSGRSWYPGEDDYVFEPERFDGSHDLVAVAIVND